LSRERPAAFLALWVGLPVVDIVPPGPQDIAALPRSSRTLTDSYLQTTKNKEVYLPPPDLH
jgi:hypothetical protein